MRVALVHDWLTGMRGGERVLEAILHIFPDADIFTLLHERGSVSDCIESRPIRVSALDRLPFARRYYRFALPFMPALIERFDFRDYDLVLSSSHCVAKGARVRDGAPHVSYCHSPMRYVWDQYDAYFGRGRSGIPVRIAMGAAAPLLRRWDRRSAERVTHFIANSEHVRSRIRLCYGRDADVVHPPVDVDRFTPAARRDDFFLVLGALVPYKRVDLVVRAFAGLEHRLVVCGDGPERRRLQDMASRNVEFTGWLPDDGVADLLGRCRALVHAGVEDFGMTLVEAQAAGAPVIAFGVGGARETVIDTDPNETGRRTGLLFHAQTVSALADAVRSFDRMEFDTDAMRRNALRFGVDRFTEEFRDRLQSVVSVKS